jgi:hypothetical protein
MRAPDLPTSFYEPIEIDSVSPEDSKTSIDALFLIVTHWVLIVTNTLLIEKYEELEAFFYTIIFRL